MTEQTQETPPASAPQRPDAVPEQFWNDETGLMVDEFANHAADLQNQVNIYNDAISQVPEEASGYEVGLPEGFEVPEGFQFSTEGDNRIDALKEWAHKNKLPPSALNDLMAVYVQDQIEGHAYMQEQQAALGANHASRTANLSVALSSRLAPEEAAALSAGVVSAAAVRGLEKLVAGQATATPKPHQVKTGQSDQDVMSIEDPFERIKHIQKS